MTVVDASGVQPATTFGTRARVPRPVLLILVYGIFLVIVGLTAVAQTAMVSADLSATTLNTMVGADATLVRLFVTSNLSPGRSRTGRPDAGAPDHARAATGIARPAGRDPAGRGPPARRAHRGRRRPLGAGIVGAPSADFTTALGGQTATAGIADARLSEAAGTPLATSDVVREYFPLITDGQVRGVVGVWRDAAPILATLDAVRWNVVLVTLSAGLIAAIVLYPRVPLGPGPDHPPDGGARRCDSIATR